MDDYMFRSYVAHCTCVQEATSYLEIFNYSVSCPIFLTWDGSSRVWDRGELRVEEKRHSCGPVDVMLHTTSFVLGVTNKSCV
jgi:hypothetical protein